MSKIGENAAKKQVVDRVIGNHEKIHVVGGACKYNFRCSYNAVHEAIDADDDKIAMVVYIDGDYPIIHFINYHNGEYVDNTLGHWCRQLDYYFIKWIHKDEFWDVNDIFGSYRDELRNSLHWLTRLTTNVTF